MLLARRREIGKHMRDLLARKERSRGLLIAFEGADGSGKTTQRKQFTEWLQTQGVQVATTKWDSAEPLAGMLKARKKAQALSPRELSMLTAAEFRFRLETQILPALWEGKTVVADRHFFTALARDAARGLELDWLLHLYAPLFFPDIVYYFQVTAETSGKRIASGQSPSFYAAGQDATDIEDPYQSYAQFMGRVVDEYNALAGIFRFVTVDGEQPVERIHQQLRDNFEKNREKRIWADWNKDAVWEWLSNHPEVLEQKAKTKPAEEDSDA